MKKKDFKKCVLISSTLYPKSSSNFTALSSRHSNIIREHHHHFDPSFSLKNKNSFINSENQNKSQKHNLPHHHNSLRPTVECVCRVLWHFSFSTPHSTKCRVDHKTALQRDVASSLNWSRWYVYTAAAIYYQKRPANWTDAVKSLLLFDA
jgi:hypothetical protein